MPPRSTEVAVGLWNSIQSGVRPSTVRLPALSAMISLMTSPPTTTELVTMIPSRRIPKTMSWLVAVALWISTARTFIPTCRFVTLNVEGLGLAQTASDRLLAAGVLVATGPAGILKRATSRPFR